MRKKPSFQKFCSNIEWTTNKAGKRVPKTIVIDNKMTIRVPENLFRNNYDLLSVTIPKGNTIEICPKAFQSCIGLESLIIEEGVKVIGKYAFADCINLEVVLLPNSLEVIEEGAFLNCAALKNVAIPKGVKICEKAFKGTGVRFLKAKQPTTDVFNTLMGGINWDELLINLKPSMFIYSANIELDFKTAFEKIEDACILQCDRIASEYNFDGIEYKIAKEEVLKKLLIISIEDLRKFRQFVQDQMKLLYS